MTKHTENKTIREELDLIIENSQGFIDDDEVQATVKEITIDRIMELLERALKQRTESILSEVIQRIDSKYKSFKVDEAVGEAVTEIRDKYLKQEEKDEI